jgi:DNA-directed RNA polymerase specialized sigma24 family protein
VVGGALVSRNRRCDAGGLQKAFRSFRSFDQRSALKTWLYRICYHAALDHVRYEKRRRHDGLDTVIQLPSSVSVAGAVEQQMELGDVVAELRSRAASAVDADRRMRLQL